MNMTDDLTGAMQQLHEPAAPASLKVTVMARIAREADRAEPAVENAATVQPARELSAWLWSVAGVAVVFVASTYGWFEAGGLPDLTSRRIGVGSPAVILIDVWTALALGLGVLMCVAGLLAPLRNAAVRRS